jgi:short-subunit dehydrogenase
MVIALGSIAGRISIPFQAHYSASKFAVEAFMEALRIEGKPFGIRCCVVEAGDTKTPFTGRRRMTIPSDSPYADPARRAIGKMEKDEQNGYAPAKVASAVFKVAQRKSPPVRKPVGTTYALLMFLKRLLPDRLAIWVVTKMYLG